MLNFIKIVILSIVVCVAVPFAALSTLFVLMTSPINPKLRDKIKKFSDKRKKKEVENESENNNGSISLVLHAIYDILDFETDLYEMSPKVAIVFEDIELLKSVMNEHKYLENDYKFELMSSIAYIAHLQNRNASYSFYYFGNDISIKPPVGILESFYFNVNNDNLENEIIETAPEPQTEIQTSVNSETMPATEKEVNEFVSNLREGDKVLFGSQELFNDFFANFGDIIKHGISFSVFSKETNRSIEYDFFVSEKPITPKKVKAKKHIRF